MTDQPQSRDETAFSVDASTGASFATQGVITRAAIAMKALDLEHVDEAGYHKLLEDDEAFSSYLNSDQIAEHDPAVVEAAADPVDHDAAAVETVFQQIAAEAKAQGNAP